MDNKIMVNYNQLINTERVGVMENEPIWITVAEAAEIMGVAESNVRYLCGSGRRRNFHCRKFGRMWQVDKQDALSYKRTNRNPEWLHNNDKDL